KIEKQPLYEDEKFESHILYKFKEEEPFKINKNNNEWNITGKEIEKLVKMTRFQTDESIIRFTTKLRKYGIDEKLRELGAVEGETVRILDFEFEYKE
ncbi:MAG: Obg family GTPase CgtA, partial [Mycoplasmatota bacterium]